MKCPCEGCICLPICMNKEALRCSILLKYLNETYVNSVYPTSSEIICNVREVLKGNWGFVGRNDVIFKVHRNGAHHE